MPQSRVKQQRDGSMCSELTVSGDAGHSHARVPAHNVVLIKQHSQQTLNNFTRVQQR